ncbi:hypothetical protein [Adhaeribacter pallidiroseus]|uniref:Uncharacterized protein n=1 Tax=Adhaeribacter pallidiroseus TaxID=2072847 RepID=A0A369QUW8_9BACT|nr:hypothetical protein [Adhaeribacter pallidiroseus]RDC65978.1 hypothetical protein AHMF7616_04609 [Adhaeribacter pallidiroseus]
MLPGFFKFIYQLFLSAPQPPQSRPVYWNEIFPTVGLVTVLSALAMMVIFYYVINHWLPIAFFRKAWHWAFFMIISAVIGFAYAVSYAHGKEVEGDYVYNFATVNALYGALFFLIFSFLLRRWSRGASTTPVRF